MRQTIQQSIVLLQKQWKSIHSNQFQLYDRHENRVNETKLINFFSGFTQFG